MESYNAVEPIGKNQCIVVGSALLTGLCFANVMDGIDIGLLGSTEEICIAATFGSVLSLGLAQLSIMSKHRFIWKFSRLLAIAAAGVIGIAALSGLIDYSFAVSTGLVSALPAVALCMIRE